jgi:nanoRNase/pAp phosphatase (c-di-AMP/oligoRNAs hydrolase)
MLKPKFEDFLTYLKDKNILITTHNFIDLDGFVSCITLKYFLIQILKQQEIKLLFFEFNKSTEDYLKNFSEKFPDFPFTFEEKIDPSEIDTILILDANKIEQVEFSENFKLIQSNTPYIFVDHHLFMENDYVGNQKSLNLIFEDFSSTAEIIYEMCEAYNIELPIPYKILLISGILTDSGFFKYGNNKTIQRVSTLLDPTFDLQDILLLLKGDTDLSKKIAKIKGLQRVKIVREGDWLIGITNVSSFEASVANSLIRVGFDVGIVISDKKSDYRISTRAKKSLCITHNLHLGRILEEVSKEIGGRGGGHDGAAGLNGKDNQKEVLDKIIEKVKQTLNN